MKTPNWLNAWNACCLQYIPVTRFMFGLLVFLTTWSIPSLTGDDLSHHKTYIAIAKYLLIGLILATGLNFVRGKPVVIGFFYLVIFILLLILIINGFVERNNDYMVRRTGVWFGIFACLLSFVYAIKMTFFVKFTTVAQVTGAPTTIV